MSVVPVERDPFRPGPVVTVSFEGPQRQRRWTVAFRVFLAIPHFVYAVVLSIVAWFAVIAGWFAALVLGRLPTGIAEFVARVVQYYARVQGYGLYLLTDRYPSFDLRSTDYAVDLDVPEGVRLNRAAVLFRLILLIPAAIVVQLVTSGVGLLVLVAWLIVLIVGRMPTALFESFASILRYSARYIAFAAMLTSEYPRGLFGDKPAHIARPAEFAPPEPPEDEPWAGPPPADDWPEPAAADQSSPPPPPAAAPSLDTAATETLPTSPRLTQLILSKGAKALVILTIVIGVVFQVASIALGDWSTGASAQELDAAYTDLSLDAQAFGVEAQRCAVSQEGPVCVHAAARDLEVAFREFLAELREIEFPDYALGQARQVEADSNEIIHTLGGMASTFDASEYEQLAFQFQELGAEFDEHVADLYDTLIFS